MHLLAEYDNDIRNIAVDPRSFVVSRRNIVYTLKSCVAHVSEIEGYLESEYRKMALLVRYTVFLTTSIVLTLHKRY